MGALISWLNNTKIVRKLMIFVFVVVLFPIITINMSFSFEMRSLYQNKEEKAFEYTLDRYAEALSYKLDLYDAVLDTVLSNGTIQGIFSAVSAYETYDRITTSVLLGKELNNMLLSGNFPELSRFAFYLEDNRFPVDGIYTIPLTQAEMETVLGVKQADLRNNETNYLYNRETDTISIVKKFYDLNFQKNAAPLGYIKLDLVASKLLAHGQQGGENGLDVLIVDEDGAILYQNNNVLGQDIQKIALDALEEMPDAPFEKVSMHAKTLLFSTLSNGWRLGVVTNQTAVDKEFVLWLCGALLMNTILVLLIVLCIRLFSKTFTERIVKINEKMRCVPNGIANAEVIEGSDEIAQIDQTFDQMMQKMWELIDSNYVAELEKEKLQLTVLQYQINPHFLYNTLEVINKMARVYGCPEICSITQNLGAMFRYNIGNVGEFVPLLSEINHIKCYLEIQQVRYENQLEVYYDIAEEVMHALVVKFILQPVVENAFSHGIVRKKNTGVIEIRAWEEDGTLLITVTDNGVGMEPDLLAQVNAALSAEKTENTWDRGGRFVGLRNVNGRIKLQYGDSYGLHIESSVGVGTKVTYRLPLKWSPGGDGKETTDDADGAGGR